MTDNNNHSTEIGPSVGKSETEILNNSNLNENEKNTSPDSNEVEIKIIPTPPDGGWGWLVVFASFIIHMINDGVMYSFGSFTPTFLEYFQTSRENVGWLASIMVGTSLASGPIASILTNRFGHRNVTIAGAIISALGFFAPYFIAHFWFLFLSASVVTGFGFGLMYLPAIVIVNLYFEKRRSTAIGIAVCGSGFGTFVLGPLIELMLSEYSWQQCMFILSAVILNGVVCGLVFRPVEITTYKVKVGSLKDLDNTTWKEIHAEPVDKSLLFLDTPLEIASMSSLNQGHGFTGRALSAEQQHTENNRLFGSSKSLLVTTAKLDDKLRSSHPNIALHASVTNLADKIETSRQISRESDRNSPGELPIKKSRSRWRAILYTFFNNLINVDMIRNPVFLLFAFSNFFTNLGFDAPFLYVKDRALQNGVDSYWATFLISFIGIGNTVGRLIFGFLGAQTWVNRLAIYSVCLVLCGVCTMLSCFCITYPWMVAYTTAFGVLSGVYVTLTSVVLADLLGADKLNESFGLTMLFQGVAVLLGPPLAGWIFDQTHSYDGSFLVCGGSILLSGLLLMPIPFIQKCMNRINERKKYAKNQPFC